MRNKLFMAIWVALIALFIATGVYAKDSNDTGYLGNDQWAVQNDGDMIPQEASTYDIGEAALPVHELFADHVTLTTPLVGEVALPLTGFTYTNGAQLSTSTAPGLEIDNLIPGIVWSDGETTPVQITMRVPADYSSGGAFRVFADSSSSTTPVQIDYSIYGNGHNTAWASAASNETPVALSTGAGTPCIVSLPLNTTDAAIITAGKIVTLNLWRDDASAGTGDLEISYVEFYYNRK
jgi:hypothetical protein